MGIQTFPITLQRAEMISLKVRHLWFSADDHPNGLPFVPGQFITVHFEAGGNKLRRSYSIASIPGESTLLEVAVGYVEDGPGTQLLHNLQVGEKLAVNGPFGRLILRDEQPKRYIFVSTSTGVTPFLSMLPELSKRLQNGALEVILLEGVQKKCDALYVNKFLDFAETHGNFHFHTHYSREKLSDPKPYEYEGYVQMAFSKLHPTPGDDIVYLCGNPSMIDDAFEQLKNLGFEIKNVRREKYLS